MKTFKVITSWTGFSEITVEAETQDEAMDLVQMGEYDCNNEVSTGNGLQYGYQDEETIAVEEIKENDNE
jgi:hypothetical protein